MKKQLKKRFLTELLPLLSQKKLISGATKTPRSAGSIHAPAARYQMTSPPPAKVIFPSFCRIGASTADSVILPVRIWYFSLHRELIRGKRQWSTRDLITDTAKAVSAACTADYGKTLPGQKNHTGVRKRHTDRRWKHPLYYTSNSLIWNLL